MGYPARRGATGFPDPTIWLSAAFARRRREGMRQAVAEAVAVHPGRVQSIELRPVLVYDDPTVGHWRIKIVITAGADPATLLVPIDETDEGIGRAVLDALSSLDGGDPR